ncbi:MAG: hypothetical protein ACREBG_28185 [Pyrinomonadaceae bacterium]
MNQKEVARIQKLQERINSALKETPEERKSSDFSDYKPDHTPALVQELMRASESGGAEGIEAALDAFDRLAQTEDVLRMKHALMLFLMHDPAVARLGLRIPSLEERSPWKVLPSKRDF